ncbi:hypothetical protein [Planctomycetes bacterium K23_9]|uniref:Uncharacterized protein n=1 Tax=Stieleria marina TaxID=1930275 RepID=A0A517NRH6_9BACT|nr:hypothetical protein K239x_16770 [Planctomycetes bacterium K23_9]
MDASPDSPEPYQLWLDIPAEYCPPNHYVLLGVDDFSDDASAIDAAAKSRAAYLHQIAAGPNRKIVQRLLGEVAVARRTLLNKSAKTEYDQWLSTPDDAPPDDSNVAPSRQTAQSVSVSPAKTSVGSTGSPNDSGTDTRSRKSTSRRRTSQWDAYKYHLLSASVLACAVGIFAFANRDGGRRATSVPELSPPPSSSARQDSANQKLATQSKVNQRPKAGTAKTASSLRKPPSGSDAKPATSGLSGPQGLDMTEFMNSGSVDSLSYQQPDETLEHTKAVACKLAPNWWDGLQQRNVFNDNLETFFADVTLTEKSFTVRNGKIFLQNAPANERHQNLVAASKRIAMGEGIAIATTLIPKIDPEVVVGLKIGEREVTLHSTKSGISVRTRDQRFDEKREYIDNLRVSGKATQSSLFLIRDKTDAKAIHWVLQAGGKGLRGTVFADLTENETPFGITFACSTTPTQKNVSIANLRVGSLKTPPSWLK